MARDGIKCSDCGRDLRAFQVIRIKGAPFCTTCFRALSVPGCGRSILVSRSWDAMAGVFIAGSVPSLVVKRSHEIALLRGRLARELTQHVMNELSGVVNWDRSAGVVTTADAVNDHKR